MRKHNSSKSIRKRKTVLVAAATGVAVALPAIVGSDKTQHVPLHQVEQPAEMTRMVTSTSTGTNVSFVNLRAEIV